MPTPSLDAVVATLPSEGSFSIWAGPVQGPARFACNESAPHYAASTMKIALVLGAYRQAEAGHLDLDNLVTVHGDFASVIEGQRFEMDHSDDSDEAPWDRMGTEVSLRWLADRAIVRSSNLATNLLLEAVGLSAVAAALESVGATDSVVARGIEDGPAREAGHQNIVTALDLARTLQALVSGTPAGRASCDEILAVLAAQQINDAIPVGLPPGTKVAHKSGWVEGISHDAGVVYPGDSAAYVFVMCTTSTLDEQPGLDLIGRASAAAWDDREALA
ncbi:MAG: serine hydrolase [Nocardioidaceae bacterium]